MTGQVNVPIQTGVECWFCGKNPADPTLSIKYDLEKHVRISGVYSGTFEVHKRTVIVPQCQYCKELRDKSDSGIGVAMIAFVGFAALLFYLLYNFTSIGDLGNFCISAVSAFILAIAIFLVLNSRKAAKEGWTEEDKAIMAKKPEDYPALKELNEAGWKDPYQARRSRR